MSLAPECEIFASEKVSVVIAYRRKDDNRRLSVKIAICAIASKVTMESQSPLRGKLAIDGIASEFNRIKMKA